MKSRADIPELLGDLRIANSASYPEELPQRLHSSIGAPRRVPTLQAYHSVPISPMIKSRFLFAASWKNACGSQTWISIAEMRRTWTSRSIQKQIALRREHWKQSVVAKHAPSRVSLFGIDLLDQQETYLLWPPKPGPEPQVFLYQAWEERCFSDFAAFLRFLLPAKSPTSRNEKA